MTKTGKFYKNKNNSKYINNAIRGVQHFISVFVKGDTW
jgi:hypothetical protein